VRDGRVGRVLKARRQQFFDELQESAVLGGLAGRGRNWGRPSTGGQPIGLPIQRRTIDARRVHILRRLANDASGQFLTATVRAATAESVNRRNATTVGQLDIIITPSKGLLVADNKDSNVKQPARTRTAITSIPEIWRVKALGILISQRKIAASHHIGTKRPVRAEGNFCNRQCCRPSAQPACPFAQLAAYQDVWRGRCASRFAFEATWWR